MPRRIPPIRTHPDVLFAALAAPLSSGVDLKRPSRRTVYESPKKFLKSNFPQWRIPPSIRPGQRATQDSPGPTPAQDSPGETPAHSAPPRLVLTALSRPR
ncbi:hypothetical protein Apa02nite_011920 [Actinoplanes palleronii]|uniref:Uncharacterized protein n=1 Tax=Actinoplanes palleronii TaxID=113570 RepID=A0ABQ4B345_9ACTN|nr:hypothetical protein Apa02nite_011920 [Actinoplanes palleronii]